jgi:hypothetical protein
LQLPIHQTKGELKMKVILTKEQAKALEYVLERSSRPRTAANHNSYDETSARSNILQTHIKDGWTDPARALNSLSVDDMVAALYGSYEVEKDLEEIINEILEHRFGDYVLGPEIIAAREAIMSAIHDHNLIK